MAWNVEQNTQYSWNKKMNILVQYCKRICIKKKWNTEKVKEEKKPEPLMT